MRRRGAGRSVRRRRPVSNACRSSSAPAHVRGTLHFGSRLAFGPDGMLYVTDGERSDSSRCGRRPSSNSTATSRQGAARHPRMGRAAAGQSVRGRAERASRRSGRSGIAMSRHRRSTTGGPAVDRRARHPRRRRNEPDREGQELRLADRRLRRGILRHADRRRGHRAHGYEQTGYYWDPVIAPSGAQFYTGEAFPAWQGSLFIGSLRERILVRLTIEGIGSPARSICWPIARPHPGRAAGAGRHSLCRHGRSERRAVEISAASITAVMSSATDVMANERGRRFEQWRTA